MSKSLLVIPNTEPAVFISRPNRFLLNAELPSKEIVQVHVPDPGRLKELLYSGNDLLIIPATKTKGSIRKTKWSLVAAKDSTGWILVNTSFHSKIAHELFSSNNSPIKSVKTIQSEVKSPSGKSRFDFLLNENIWVEVKGCTLKIGKEALFPDAPTTRGLKHIKELTEMAQNGIHSAVVFLIFVREVDYFTANKETDPNFALALRTAKENGVEIYPVQLNFDGKHVTYKQVLNYL